MFVMRKISGLGARRKGGLVAAPLWLGRGNWAYSLRWSNLALSFSLSSILFAGLAMAEMHNPSPDRPIRYLWWNVPAAVLEGLVASDATHVTDGEFKSDEITDYDAAIVFLDSWSQISDFQYTKEFGINEDDVRGTEDTKLVYTAEVYFQGKASKFNVFLFNKANFMGRDQNCYGKLLLEIMLLYASGSPSGRVPLEEFKVCKEEPK